MVSVLEEAEMFIMDTFPESFRLQKSQFCKAAFRDEVWKLFKAVFPTAEEPPKPLPRGWWFTALCLMPVSRRFNLGRVNEHLQYCLSSDQREESPFFSFGPASRHHCPPGSGTGSSTVTSSVPYQCLEMEEKLLVSASFMKILEGELQYYKYGDRN